MGIKLDPNSDNQVMVVKDTSDSLEICKEFPGVFSDNLGCLVNFEHKIILKINTVPIVHKVRRVPRMMLEPLKAELNRLLGAGVIEEIESSEWLAPVVLAPKDNGKRIRMCVDLRDLNKNIWLDRQPLPNITEELSCLGGSKVSSVLDLSSAYHQIVLHPESRHLTSFVTPLGAYQFLRMPFGLASAAACFQRVMKRILGDIVGTLCFQDDILVHGKSVDEHDKILRTVLSKLAEAGLTVKKEKFSSEEEVEDELTINWVREMAISKEEWEMALEGDLDRHKLREFVVKGWPEFKDVPDSLKGYWNVRDELSLDGNELYRGDKFVPPKDLRNKILNLAHEGHLGRSLTKSRLRAIYWWPGLDSEAEAIVKDCLNCALSDKSKKVARAPLSPVVVPDKTLG
ncbi:hypothetical protein NDU88_001486 [Pleurodeles waltl]|uniref:Gypsy retrotransposon integrase-like protein 1 n=1 Tax=Pleurodeles waltl TaxID=8319 RepID=A0AAV7WMG3_PLEWA|nr:hypothetical protein NDU88_001486 [Pleurodeles waltl]